MKLLYISPSPPNNLERVRSLNILKSLQNKNIDITLVTLYNKEQEKYIEESKKYVNRIIKIKYSKIISIIYAIVSMFLPVPIRVGYCFNFRLRKFLKINKEKYDIAYIKRLRMAQYKKFINATKIYIDITDSLTKYYERISKREKRLKKFLCLEEYYKHKKYEVKICEENKNIIICSEDDKRYIENLSSRTIGNISVIENVIELDKWNVNNIRIKPIKERNKLVFFGIMDYEPNILAADFIINKIMPQLDKKYVLEIVGPKVPPNLKKLENERIKFSGYVKSIKNKLAENDIFLCPILAGSGTKNKILQAGTVGLPIICTDIGLEGLNNQMKEVVYVANTEKEFIEKIEEINNTEKVYLEDILKKQKEIIKKYNSLEVIEKKIIKIR